MHPNAGRAAPSHRNGPAVRQRELKVGKPARPVKRSVGRVTATGARAMQLDLAKSRPALAAWITAALSKAEEAPERKGAPVTRSDLSFDLTSMDVPVVHLGFSTYPNGDPGRVRGVPDHPRPAGSGRAPGRSPASPWPSSRRRAGRP